MREEEIMCESLCNSEGTDTYKISGINLLNYDIASVERHSKVINY